MDQLPRLGKRELICLLLFTCNYVVSVWRGFLFLWVLGMGYVILLWHSLSLPYNYFSELIPSLGEERSSFSVLKYLLLCGCCSGGFTLPLGLSSWMLQLLVTHLWPPIFLVCL